MNLGKNNWLGNKWITEFIYIRIYVYGCVIAYILMF